jgi:hypothetical protein
VKCAFCLCRLGPHYWWRVHVSRGVTTRQKRIAIYCHGISLLKKDQTNTEIHPHVESCPPIFKQYPMMRSGATKMVYKSLWKRSNSDDTGILINVLWNTKNNDTIYRYVTFISRYDINLFCIAIYQYSGILWHPYMWDQACPALVIGC